MGNCIGIDLGTTNSVGAFKAVNVEVVTDEAGKSLTRSVVGLDGGEIVVGEKAYRQSSMYGETINSIKRMMGRGFNDPIVQQQAEKLSYTIKASSQGTEDSLVVILGGKEYEPEDISAEILKQVVKNAKNYRMYQKEFRENPEITEVVITIPAYFNDKQKQATQNAAKRAGLEVTELLSEPTAAAISFGSEVKYDDDKMILVYDFGGGTFDSSVINVAQDFLEMGKAGDLWLGGDDIDDKLIGLVKQKVAEEENLENIDNLIAKMPALKQRKLLGNLKLAAEQAKIDLSRRPEAKIEITEPLIDEFGSLVYIQSVITRSEFEPMILPLVERTIKICQQAIKDSDETEDSIDIILMLGGSSQIPIVQRKVKELFGEDKVIIHPRPMYAVAEGAGIVAAGLVEKTLTVSRNYCIKLADDPRFILIDKGTDLPVERKSHTFKLEADGQRLIHFKFFSPDEVRDQLDNISNDRHNDETIGQMWLALDKHYPKGTEVTILTEIEAKNEAVQMTAFLRNDESVKVSCSLGRGGKDDVVSREVETLINQLNEEGSLSTVGVESANELATEVIQASNSMMGSDGRVLEDRKRVTEQKLKRLKNYVSDDYNVYAAFVNRFNFALEHCQSLIPEEQQLRLKNLVNELNSAVEKENTSGLEKFLEDAKKENDNLPDLVSLILFCRDAISRAVHINPTAANAMSEKFGRILDALKHDDILELKNILQQLLPDAEKYWNQEIASGTIATGLTR